MVRGLFGVHNRHGHCVYLLRESSKRKSIRLFLEGCCRVSLSAVLTMSFYLFSLFFSFFSLFSFCLLSFVFFFLVLLGMCIAWPL